MFAFRAVDFHFEHEDGAAVQERIIGIAMGVLREHAEIAATDEQIDDIFSFNDGETAVDFVWPQITTVPRALGDVVVKTCASRVNAALPRGFRTITLARGDLDPNAEAELRDFMAKVTLKPDDVSVFSLRATRFPDDGKDDSAIRSVAEVIKAVFWEHIDGVDDREIGQGLIVRSCRAPSGRTVTVTFTWPWILVSKDAAEHIAELCVSRIARTLPKKISSATFSFLDVKTLNEDDVLLTRIKEFTTLFGIDPATNKHLKVDVLKPKRESTLPNLVWNVSVFSNKAAD